MFNVHFKLIAMGLLWATSYPLGRYLAAYEAPQALVVIRTLIAFVFLLFIARRRREPPIALNPRLVGQFLILGFCGFCLHNFLMFEALEHTQANTGAVINGAIPVVVMVLDFLVFRRTIARWSIVGVAIGFIGTAIVVSHGDLGSLLRGRIGYGELLFLIAITGWAGYTIIARPLLEQHPSLGVTAYACLAGGVLMLPAMIWNIDSAIIMLSDPRIVALLAVQGVLTIGLGFLWYCEGVQALGPMNAAVYINLVPIFGIVLAAVTINELPSRALLTGAALVVGGLLLVNRAEARRARLNRSPDRA
ncbi:MAG: DMT family transporter [Gammaproteobacteria bacterium]|jgi:drug/metabolite transporter (DMT)-like permease